MALDKNHVVTLKYVLHTNDESGEKVFVEETSEENPLTFLLWCRNDDSEV
jgi:FKBP-type peptidyl-prolyl cis-trans isomerase SlyD